MLSTDWVAEHVGLARADLMETLQHEGAGGEDV